MASLWLVSPGAATDGVTPIFPERKLTTFFSHRRLQSGAPVRPRLSTVISKFSPMFFFRVSPLEGVTRGDPPPPVTPLYVSAVCNFHTIFNNQTRSPVAVGRGVARGGGLGACPPVTVGQFLSRPRWCSLGFPYSSPGPRWGLPSTDPLVCPPLVNSWLRPWQWVTKRGRARGQPPWVMLSRGDPLMKV